MLILFFLQISISLADDKSLFEIPSEKKAQFIQTKYIKKFKTKLVSQGDINFFEKKIEFLQSKPFVNKLEIYKDKIIENGEILETNMNTFNKLLVAFFKGNLEALKGEFTVEHKMNKDYVLTPKKALFKKIFTKIELKGEKYITFIKIVELNGNYTQISLKNFRDYE